jgi:hypothetical protein
MTSITPGATEPSAPASPSISGALIVIHVAAAFAAPAAIASFAARPAIAAEISVVAISGKPAISGNIVSNC